jgi:hypothetical protein
MAGASSSQVKVTDPTGSNGTTSGFNLQDGSTQTGSDGAGRQDRDQEQHAWMRDGSTSARDGRTTGAAPLFRPTDPGTLTPLAGVDVTM